MEGPPLTRRRLGASYRFAVCVLRPPLMVLTRREWQGAEHLPHHRGFVAVTNHISHLDPFTFAHFLHDSGCPPRFLAKDSVFRMPGIGRILTGAGQIPVYRESADAGRALRAAVAAVERGECVAIYPESTLTRDPGLWPMVGKTGAARVALATGCPVIPIAQWGVQEMLPPYGKRVRLLPRPTVHVHAGPPVDLSPYQGRQQDMMTMRAATETILDAVTGLLADLRGETPPQQRWDPREHGQPRTGNPLRAADRGPRPDREGAA